MTVFTRRTRTKEPACDIVVVGGGITGAGIARDAALRGLRVVLFEKSDFGAGTSSKSSKLIHGGLRYLEHAQFGLVTESVRERQVLCRLAPHLVRPLPFLFPIYQGARVGLETVNLGLWIYDALATFRSAGRHRTYRGGSAATLEPALRREGFRGAIEYYDCVTDDARLVLENILDARAVGADCRNHTEVTRLERAANGAVQGVGYRDRITGEEGALACHAVVVAVGPWTDELNHRVGLGLDRSLLRPTKGVHLVVTRRQLPVTRAVTLLAPQDGRVLFVIPWRQRTVVGTTDTDFQGRADQVQADREDVDYLCAGVNHYFPGANVRPENVLATWAGLRPLVASGERSTGDVSREHTILARDDGVTIIAGGKITTYRKMAQQCVNATLRSLRLRAPTALAGHPPRRGRTARRPLPGGRGIAASDRTGVERFSRDLARKYHLTVPLANHLAEMYGSRAESIGHRIEQTPDLAAPLQDDLPHIWAEIDFAVTEDLARTIEDVLARRLSISLLGRQQGLDLLPAVADRVAERLGWSAEFKAEQIQAYRHAVAATRAFRQ